MTFSLLAGMFLSLMCYWVPLKGSFTPNKNKIYSLLKFLKISFIWAKSSLTWNKSRCHHVLYRLLNRWRRTIKPESKKGLMWKIWMQHLINKSKWLSFKLVFFSSVSYIYFIPDISEYEWGFVGKLSVYYKLSVERSYFWQRWLLEDFAFELLI